MGLVYGLPLIPHGAFLAGILTMTNKLRHFLKKSTLLKKLKWDYDYLRGTWKFLDSDQEDGRYRNIIAMMNEGCPVVPSILEMGCGEGVFPGKLKDFAFDSYTGIDFSDVAIRKAVSKRFGNAAFAVGNMNTWTTEEKFDVIIFNESIYYSDDPVAQLNRYSKWLTSRGRIIVSIYIMAPTQPVVHSILNAFKPVGEMEVYTKEMGYWRQYMFAF